MNLTRATLAAAAIAALLPNPSTAAPAKGVPCSIAPHRAVAPNTDEEQRDGIAYSTRFRWGAEIDARLSKDGTPWAIHDSGIGRITGGAVKRRVIDMTDDELRAVTLVNGGRPWTIRSLIAKAANVHARLLIELKPVPPGSSIRWAHAPAGTDTGFDQLAAAATDKAMADRLLWTTSRPDVWTNLVADARFNTRLAAKPWAWNPNDPATLAGLRVAYLAPEDTTSSVVDVVQGAGVTPLRHVGPNSTTAALDAGVRFMISHYPEDTQKACDSYVEGVRQ